MTNPVATIDPTNVPAHIAQRINQGGTSLSGSLSSGIGGESTPRVSIRGGSFRLIKGGAEIPLNSQTLDVIIVGANAGLSKKWYSKQFDGSEGTDNPPDCLSYDGKKPDASSSDPQSETCAMCERNKWGSDRKGSGKGKDCADHKRLVVVTASDMTGDSYLLSVSPAALSNLNAYSIELSSRGIPPQVVITTLGLDTSEGYPQMTFKFSGQYVPENALQPIEELVNSSETAAIANGLPTMAKAALPAPTAAPVQIPAPAPAPAPAAQEAQPVTPVAQPTLQPATPAPQPVAQPTLQPAPNPNVEPEPQSPQAKPAILDGMGEAESNQFTDKIKGLLDKDKAAPAGE